MSEVAKKPLGILVVLLLAVVAADQATKQWARRALMAPAFLAEESEYTACGDPREEGRRERFLARHRESVTVIDGFFDLKYVENCASAFGMMSRVPQWLRFPFYLGVSILALVFIPYLYRRTPASQRLMLFGLPFVLGGALGNLIDRLVYRYVIDFVEWYVVVGGEPRRWPTFNVADAAIVAGIGLMVLEMLAGRRARGGSERAGVGGSRVAR